MARINLPDDETDWTDRQLVDFLTERYSPSVIPPCRICGGELSVQAVGGGQPTKWACTGREAEWPKFKPGRSFADEHYGQSYHLDYRQGGDPAVMELLRRWIDE